MILHAENRYRRGATMMEYAITSLVFWLIVLGVIVVGLGVFRYQQVAAIAREGARWASVHGGQYNLETGNAMATKQTVTSDAVLPFAAGLDPSQLTVTVVSWDNPNQMPINGSTPNYVTVTVSYYWVPEFYFGSVNLSSTSKQAMQY